MVAYTTYVLLGGNIMKKSLEKLWNEYFAEECATIKTKEERSLTKKAIEMYDAVNKLLQNEQIEVVYKYIDALCEVQGLYAKRAFFTGCEFAISFITEAGYSKE